MLNEVYTGAISWFCTRRAGTVGYARAQEMSAYEPKRQLQVHMSSVQTLITHVSPRATCISVVHSFRNGGGGVLGFPN